MRRRPSAGILRDLRSFVRVRRAPALRTRSRWDASWRARIRRASAAVATPFFDDDRRSSTSGGMAPASAIARRLLSSSARCRSVRAALAFSTAGCVRMWTSRGIAPATRVRLPSCPATRHPRAPATLTTAVRSAASSRRSTKSGTAPASVSAIAAAGFFRARLQHAAAARDLAPPSSLPSSSPSIATSGGIAPTLDTWFSG
mmetsp:Transcript_38144/g.122448  ORF Transcript_38144/g.122448 Transcript_38144/m.122448 type:complete len:201 (-) Transcript_38144:4-606(-)